MFNLHEYKLTRMRMNKQKRIAEPDDFFMAGLPELLVALTAEMAGSTMRPCIRQKLHFRLVTE
jgi:hypothetical protein